MKQHITSLENRNNAKTKQTTTIPNKTTQQTKRPIPKHNRTKQPHNKQDKVNNTKRNEIQQCKPKLN